ncbi:MAG: hypothetical protein A3C07_03455 [Candidatus Sungbacteria bacterium RIFCSPHIGHO2_02_FULL_47_11]|uniref:Uncharacterized protein n=1 Tax=Candidatus Sungbacteria bacterium RIFCSPHIGHO2_02_FULL_47_11 TaxID=1802270 RepID=A0A1G2KLQ3_9BACT|nr:MAG: hypothetical protein A3C07_03455 [Candidatus Sungbacteria bacterium RIFCSPHIGHO2_02_FULL_47_11]
MSIDPQYFIITFPQLLGAAVVAVVFLVLAVLAGAAFIKHLFLTQEESEKIKQEARRESATMLEEARTESSRIVENANAEAANILRETHVLVSRATKELEEEFHVFSQKESDRLREAATHFADAYQLMTKQAKDVYAEATKRAVEAIGRETAGGLSHFSSAVENETKRYQRSVDERLEEWHKDAQKEIAAYKVNALEKVDESIYRVLLMVSQQAIGRALDFKDHQGFMVRALEEAKHEGFFGKL